MSKALVIVESPAKARTISKFLGKDFMVESSIGHIRDLPSKAAEIPAIHKKKKWARTGVDVDNGFKPLYVIPLTKKQHVKKLKEMLEQADVLYLATDEDREGEAIAWHLFEVLKPKVPVKRMVFHEITKEAIQKALQNPREIDQQLVDAQESRRILDRLFGYEVSPVLWRKVRPRLSAGRVQSVAVRLIVNRERKRMAFNSGEYWSLQAFLNAKSVIQTNCIEVGGRRIAGGKDFDPNTGLLSEGALKANALLLNGKTAKALETGLKSEEFTVDSVKQKPFSQKPSAPFITSSLQQDAARKLRFTAKRTMRIAQRLYENGYITYMRTDSTTLSAQALTAARQQIKEKYGSENLPDAPRSYFKKAKGAQEAHEAIRPSGSSFRTPASLRNELDDEGMKLYDLIWKRTVASQMKDARGERTQVRLSANVSAQVAAQSGADIAGKAVFSVGGKVITFPGFLLAYVEGSDDPGQDLGDKERILPPMKQGDTLKANDLEAKGHQTQPPARFTEASLIKILEEKGIGRPSTYASIIQTVQDRGYVWKKGSALVPTLTAFAVVNLLEQHFGDLVNYEFTANMEQDLDQISQGQIKAKPWLSAFYFGKGKASSKGSGVSDRDLEIYRIGLQKMIGEKIDDIDAREICSFPIGETKEGDVISARVGRYGPYLQVGDTDVRANLPEEYPADELDPEKAIALFEQASIANRILGEDPETKATIYLKTGRFGPYFQNGDPELTPKGNIKKGSKPRMASLWPNMSIETVTVAEALQALAFPKILGTHPETKEEITVSDGQFGPYIMMNKEDDKKESRSLTDHEHMVNLTLKDAIDLFAQPKVRGRRQAAGPLATLAESPVTKKPILIKTGRFGPYVTDGQVNATIPTSKDPLKVTFDDALELIASREEKMRAQGKDPRPVKKVKKASKKKASKKKTSKKKTSKKKTSKKKSTKKKVVKKATQKKVVKKISKKKP